MWSIVDQTRSVGGLVSISDYTGWRRREFEDLDDEAHLSEGRVIIKGRRNPYPYCHEHGAMTKVAQWDGGGIWRCQGIAEHGEGHLEVSSCGIGCKEVPWEDPVGFEGLTKTENAGNSEN